MEQAGRLPLGTAILRTCNAQKNKTPVQKSGVVSYALLKIMGQPKMAI
jgi:hypothetical protein